MARKDLLARLADAGEEAISKLGDAPGSDKLLGFAHNMRERMDEMQKKVRGIDDLEKRVTELERRLAAQGGDGGSSSRASASRAKSRPSSAAGKRSTAASSAKSSSSG